VKTFHEAFLASLDAGAEDTVVVESAAVPASAEASE
jgi:hypothetical protein